MNDDTATRGEQSTLLNAAIARLGVFDGSEARSDALRDTLRILDRLLAGSVPPGSRDALVAARAKVNDARYNGRWASALRDLHALARSWHDNRD